MICRNDGFVIQLKEINRQKGAKGEDALKNQTTFIPGTRGTRRTTGGIVPDYLAAAESALPSLHVIDARDFQERIAVRLEVGAYAAAFRSGPSHSRARLHHKKRADSVYKRAARQAFTVIEKCEIR